MMTRILLLSVALFIGLQTFAQQALRVGSIGVRTGLSTYYGELNNRAFPASPESADLIDNLDYLSWGVDYETYLGNAWGIGLSYTKSEFSSSDRAIDWSGDFLRKESFFNRSINVNTKIQQLSLYGIWSGNNGKFFREAAFFSPFAKFGIGVLKFTPRGDLISEAGNIYSYSGGNPFESDGTDLNVPTRLDGNFETELRELNTEGSPYGNYSVSILGGLGLNFRMSKKFSLQIGTDVRYTFTDNLDNVSGSFENFSDPLAAAANNPANFDLNSTRGESGNDWYALTYVGARFYFGNRADKFKSPVVVLGDLPLGDTLVTDVTPLFTFDPPEPLKPLEMAPIPMALPSFAPIFIPELSLAPPAPIWADEDEVVPSIEDEDPRGEIIIGDDSYAREEMNIEGSNIAPVFDSTSRPPQIVTTYPEWASEENFKISDSLSNAIKNLNVKLGTSQTQEVNSRVLDSLSSSAFAKTSQIDSLRAELAVLKMTVQKDSAVVRGADTVFVERMVAAPVNNEDLEATRKLKAELARLSQEVEDTEAYRERLIEQEENRFKLLAERDRQLAKEAKRDDQTQRKYDRGLIKNDAAEVKAMRQLRLEQAALKFEVAKLSGQLAELKEATVASETAPVVIQPAQPATPVAQAPQVIQQAPVTDPLLIAQLTGLRQEVAALRESLAARPVPTPAAPVVVVPPTPASRPAPIVTAPKANEAEVLEVLSQYGSAQVFFETGKSAVSSASINSLRGLATGVRQYPNRLSVTLTGFTDKTGSLSANQALSQRRVESVRSALVQLGVSPTQIRSTASGPDMNASDDASARRVELTLRVR